MQGNGIYMGVSSIDFLLTIHTDASLNGLGDGFIKLKRGDRVIAYASRSLKPSEKNYPAHKLKFLPFKWSVTEKFHDYLYGSSFEFITDNNTLTYILTTAKLDATGQRWVASLSDYNFTIKYRSSKKNAHADGLSRRQEGNTGECIFFICDKGYLNVSDCNGMSIY